MVADSEGRVVHFSQGDGQIVIAMSRFNFQLVENEKQQQNIEKKSAPSKRFLLMFFNIIKAIPAEEEVKIIKRTYKVLSHPSTGRKYAF